MMIIPQPPVARPSDPSTSGSRRRYALATAGVLGVLCLLGGCVPATPPVAPPPRPVPPAAPAPPTPPPVADWTLRPLTPGDWRYHGAGRASFGGAGGARLALTCDASSRALTLARTEAPGAALTVRTSYGAQTIQGPVAASAPLWDQIVFSRGRILIEAPGVADLVVPTWAEIGRVVEDCRR